MTHNELIDLSKAAAKVAGVAPYDDTLTLSALGKDFHFWLHEDNARCFELMCRYEMLLSVNGGEALVNIHNPAEMFINHNNDREQATRVAILKAIVAIGEQK